ncbi:class F sortase [Egicoccus halophilus]|uniref:class F sortase n=1 Tax=Egicoccus halophilus TaxID=1670830 RepID=UPI00103075DA|nr:class F sortase [Egicoccus halophilus]
MSPTFRVGRRHRLVAVAAAAVMLALGSCAVDSGEEFAAPPAPAMTPDATPPPVAAPVEPAVPDGIPVRVAVPAIAVDAELVSLGLADDGAMEVPDFGLAGWYAEGPMPGHPGPAAIAAHVDSRQGPDVFFRLRELVAGDIILVHYDRGDVAEFVVESSTRTPKDELPVDDIWPVTSERRLTLITCGGEFDRSTRHYVDNVVVYAAAA